MVREGYVPVGKFRLFYRDVGDGPPIVVLHGGPDFAHSYFLPDLDRLADNFRLIYYDQRGRGRSASDVVPEDVSIESDIEDIDRVRGFFGLDCIAVLGHSWGGLVAAEYAIRYPERVSQLIFLNTAPGSHDDFMLLHDELPRRRAPGDAEKMRALAATSEYQRGDFAVVREYYRVHFRPTVRQPAHLERVVTSLTTGFSNEGVVLARAIEQRLYEQTWLKADYDLFPKLEQLRIPTLVLHGDHDLIPVQCAEHFAAALESARLVVLHDCGHFSFIECPDQVATEIGDLLHVSDERAVGTNLA